MENSIQEQICREYGLEVLDCILNELSKIPGFERLAVIKHAHDFLVKECQDEAAVLLTGENNQAEYIKLKNKLDALLPGKQEQLRNVLEIGNIYKILGGE